MKENERKQLETIAEEAWKATEFERALILAYTQGLIQGKTIAREEIKTEKKEAFENHVQVSRI